MGNDRELLEAAANAAWLKHNGFTSGRGLHVNGDPEYESGWWNPITNDGDALRLAVKLALEIRPGVGMVTAAGNGVWEEVPTAEYSREEATRRAIVQAAAATRPRRVLGAA